MDIRGVAAVVTGAASGLGASTASHLADLGARVIAFDLAGGLPEKRHANGIHFIHVDVTDPDAISRGLDEATAGTEPLRVAVSCAGIAPSARTLSQRGAHDLDLYAKVVGINLVGAFNMTLAAECIAATVPAADGQRGVIINTASIAGYEGQIGQATYASSKAGVIGLTIAAARDLAQPGIRVTTIAPGVMETPMLATVSDDLVKHDCINGEVLRTDRALRMATR